MRTVSVRLFARFRERAGTDVVAVQLPAGATAAGLREQLGRMWPDAIDLLAKSVVAVNEDYVTEDRVIAAGDDVALIPPVSGGHG